MAHSPESFSDRLEATHTQNVVALYNRAQEVRAALALLPEFDDDESEIMDGLRDAARCLFQEIFIWSKPQTAEDYGVIFDVTEAKWSEEHLKALRCAEVSVTMAHDWLLRLIAVLEVETADPGYEDLVFHLREQVVHLVNPHTVDQVRGFPKALHGLGLVHVLDKYKVHPGTSPVRVREAEGWVIAFLDRDWPEIARVMGNPDIHTAGDLLDWGRKQREAAAL